MAGNNIRRHFHLLRGRLGAECAAFREELAKPEPERNQERLTARFLQIYRDLGRLEDLSRQAECLFLCWPSRTYRTTVAEMGVLRLGVKLFLQRHRRHVRLSHLFPDANAIPEGTAWILGAFLAGHVPAAEEPGRQEPEDEMDAIESASDGEEGD